MVSISPHLMEQGGYSPGDEQRRKDRIFASETMDRVKNLQQCGDPVDLAKVEQEVSRDLRQLRRRASKVALVVGVTAAGLMALTPAGPIAAPIAGFLARRITKYLYELP